MERGSDEGEEIITCRFGFGHTRCLKQLSLDYGMTARNRMKSGEGATEQILGKWRVGEHEYDLSGTRNIL
jgi:hypothetical protein